MAANGGGCAAASATGRDDGGEPAAGSSGTSNKPSRLVSLLKRRWQVRTADDETEAGPSSAEPAPRPAKRANYREAGHGSSQQAGSRSLPQDVPALHRMLEEKDELLIDYNRRVKTLTADNGRLAKDRNMWKAMAGKLDQELAKARQALQKREESAQREIGEERAAKQAALQRAAQAEATLGMLYAAAANQH
mmetsp:Transcript_46392/g.117497  ORF Transcript_46392/g.117497 Transcript_46392/m.117497 type:complete len:192 (+) Transcript_46392:236-811(+)